MEEMAAAREHDDGQFLGARPRQHVGQRDYVVLEVNRRAISSADAYNRLAKAARPGDIVALYIYVPGLDQRAIRAVRVDAP